jgi:release factor glutamine methyltransferase
VSPAGLLRAVAARLVAVAEDAARLEARWLIEAAAGDAARLQAFVARRLAGEPVDRIIGSRGFWTLDLAVTPDVLSPRPDTETIVRAALERIAADGRRDAPLRILDLGTGSGAILLALLKELPEATGLGVDISEPALAVACGNAGQTGLQGRAAFRTGDWTTGLPGPFDLIVSNPPYIPTGAIASLDREVREHDPHLALDGGADGLACYRAICAGIQGLLALQGFAVLEFGQGQGGDIQRIAEAAGLFFAGFRNDLNGIERAIILNKN